MKRTKNQIEEERRYDALHTSCPRCSYTDGVDLGCTVYVSTPDELSMLATAYNTLAAKHGGEEYVLPWRRPTFRTIRIDPLWVGDEYIEVQVKKYVGSELVDIQGFSTLDDAADYIEAESA